MSRHCIGGITARSVNHRSVSQLNSYSRCGLSYFLSRVAEGVSESPAAWSFQGVAVHKAIESFELSNRTASLGELFDIFTVEWNRLIESAKDREPNLDAWLTGGRKKTENDIRDRYSIGKSQIETYVNYCQTDPLEVWTLPDTGKPAIEVPFDIDVGGIRVVGYIDQIKQDPNTGDLLVRDIKTGSKKPHGYKQLVVYRYAIESLYSTPVLWGDYWMAKDGRPCDPIYLGGHARERIQAWFQMMDFAERNGIYLSNEGDHCRTCSVAPYCPDMGGTSPEGIHFLGT